MTKLTFLRVAEGETFTVWTIDEGTLDALIQNLRPGVVLTGVVLDTDDECTYDMVRDLTDGDPLADLTIEDATRLIEEGKRQGYVVPDDLTPELFLDIYNDMKDEED